MSPSYFRSLHKSASNRVFHC